MTGRVVDVDIDVSLGCSVDHGGAGKAGRVGTMVVVALLGRGVRHGCF